MALAALDSCSLSPCLPAVAATSGGSQPQPKYDLLLQGGHVIDARNQISAVRDVAIAGGQGRRGRGEDRSGAMRSRSVDVSGLYVTPGLIDIHAHTYAGTGERRILCRRQQRLPGRLHAARRRDDGRGCRMRRLAELRGLQAARHRSLEDPHPRLSQHRRQRHARRQVRAGSRRHGGEADRRHGAAATRASSSASRPRTTRGPSGRRSSARSKPERSRTCR